MVFLRPLCIWQSLVRRCPCLRSTVTSFFWEMTSGHAVFNSLLGSTVDTYLCQSAEACGISRIALREGGPRILRSIPSCAGGFLTDFTHFHDEGALAELDTVTLGRISHIFLMKVAESGLGRIFWHFLHSVRMDVSAHFSSPR